MAIDTKSNVNTESAKRLFGSALRGNFAEMGQSVAPRKIKSCKSVR